MCYGKKNASYYLYHYYSYYYYYSLLVVLTQRFISNIVKMTVLSKSYHILYTRCGCPKHTSCGISNRIENVYVYGYI